MVSFEEIILRLDEISIEEILGSETLKLIIINNPNINSLNLKKIILNNFSPIEILRNKTHRIHILESLKVHEAEILLQILSIPKGSESVYDTLKTVNFRKKSNSEKKLFDYFRVFEEEEEESVEIENTIQKSECSYPLFLHQRDAIRELESFFSNGTSRILLHMPTGSGKTRTSMNVVCTNLRKQEPGLIFWLASTEELCMQAANEFLKAWNCLGDRKVEIYRFWGNHTIKPEDVTDGIIIAGLPKLVSAVKRDDGINFIANLANKADLIIMDEAHQAIAPTYQMVIEALFNIGHNSNKKLLGLSATPGRTWNDVEEDLKLAQFFSRTKVTLKMENYDNPVDYLVDHEYLSKTNYIELKHYSDNDFSEFKINEDTDIPLGILKKLGEDLDRNEKIINAAAKMVVKHNRIIIFAPSVQSSDLISFVLQSMGINSYSITGELDSYERKKNINKYLSSSNEPMVLVNYGVLTTGFDAPKTSAAIIARPTKSLVLYSQMVGRAIRGRKAGGNLEAEIITIIDQNLPGFKSVSSAFENWEDVWE